MKGKRIISLGLALSFAACVAVVPATEVRAANSTYDQAAIRQTIWDFYMVDYYDQVHAAAINKWRDLVNKGASQKAISDAWMECVTAGNNRAYAQAKANDLMNRAIASGNPTKYIDNLLPQDPAILDEPVDWAVFTKKNKYDQAQRNNSYTHSQLVNQAAYNGIIGQMGAYSVEQGNINAVNEYRKSGL